MSRFPPPRFPVPPPNKDKAAEKAAADKEAGNALWRLDEWFKDADKGLLSLLKAYHTELLKFNARLNLISRPTEREADETHFADCLMAARLLPKDAFSKPIYDIGSGNGMPGLVLAMMSPSTEIFLVESDSRKCEFLKHVQHTLKLPKVQVLNVRLETLQGQVIPSAVSRGFATVTKTLLSMNKCMAKGGTFYHLKGNGWSSEVAEIPSQLISLWRPELVGEYSLPVSQVRRAVVATLKV